MRMGLLMLLDALLISASLLMGLQVYYDMHAPAAHILHVWRSLPLLIVSTVALLHMMGFYRGILKYAGVDLLLQIACGTLGGTGITYLVSFLCYSIRREPNIFLMPRPVYLVQWLLLMVMLAASRFVIKVAQGGGWTHFFTGGSAKARRVMVVGGGWGGAQVIRDMQAGRYGDCVPVIVVDDDESRRNTRIGRVRVVMDTGKIADYVKQYAIDDIIIAIATPKSDLTELMHTCVDTGCHVRRYTVMQEMNGGQGQMRDINIADLLGRDEKHLDMSEVEQVIAGRRVLVTGGGGSIGSEMCRQMMAFIPEKLVLYDISENYMYDLFAELKNKYGEIVKNTVVLRVGSIRDEATLNQVFDEFKPEIVIHAAAHKHVPLMEDSPEQAVRNNVFGTYNVAKCAKEHGAKRFVMISTDKAVNPTNVMGASKRMAEIIIEAMQKQSSTTQFTAVRFGNVLGSNGSVVPLFERQIRAGGPVTLTHPDIIRYFMTIPEAASLVLQAASIARGGELFVLDMGKPVKIRELKHDAAFRVLQRSAVKLLDLLEQEFDRSVGLYALRDVSGGVDRRTVVYRDLSQAGGLHFFRLRFACLREPLLHGVVRRRKFTVVHADNAALEPEHRRVLKLAAALYIERVPELFLRELLTAVPQKIQQQLQACAVRQFYIFVNNAGWYGKHAVPCSGV